MNEFKLVPRECLCMQLAENSIAIHNIFRLLVGKENLNHPQGS